MNSYRQNRRRGGQSLVELALTLPLVLILGLGIADIGRGYFYREAVANAARQALRVAVLQPQQAAGNTACAGGGSSASLSTTLPPSAGTLSTIGNEASLESTTTGLPSGTTISGATMTVTWHCASNVAVTNTTATSTDPSNTGSAAVEVQVSYPMTLITPFLGNFVPSPLSIKADITARAQY